MNITLDQSDIDKAIKQYISNQGIDLTNKKIDVLLVYGRKGNGSKAEVLITDAAKPEFKFKEEFESDVPKIPSGPINRTAPTFEDIKKEIDTVAKKLVDFVIEEAEPVIETFDPGIELEAASEPDPEPTPILTKSLFSSENVG